MIYMSVINLCRSTSNLLSIIDFIRILEEFFYSGYSCFKVFGECVQYHDVQRASPGDSLPI